MRSEKLRHAYSSLNSGGRSVTAKTLAGGVPHHRCRVHALGGEPDMPYDLTTLGRIPWAYADALGQWSSSAQSFGLGRILPFVGDEHEGFADGHHHCSPQWLDLAVLAVIATTFIIGLRMWHQTHRRRLELAREMIAHGVEPHQGLLGLSAGNDLRRGVVSSAAGIGLLVASYWATPHNVSPAGLLPLFIGIGYLVSAKLTERRETAPP